MAKVEGLAPDTKCLSTNGRGYKRHIAVRNDDLYSTEVYCGSSVGNAQYGYRSEALREFNQKFLCEECVTLVLGQPFVFEVVETTIHSSSEPKPFTFLEVMVNSKKVGPSWNLTQRDEAQAYIERIVQEYRDHYGERFIAEVK